MRLADAIAVLRDGRLVASGPATDFDVPRLIRSMIGRDLKQLYPTRSAPPHADPVLEVKGLSQPGIIENVSFAIRRGEILGLFGLMGSGRTELARILFGLDEVARGSIAIACRRRDARRGFTPGDSIRDGLAFVTENRREEGLMMEAPVADNVALVSLGAYARTPLGITDRPALRSAVGKATANMRVKTANFERQPVKSLSGGNQQKVVLAKWLLTEPTVFILDEPTRGVDVGSKFEIYAIADGLAAAGNGVLFVSSELDELIAMCDRILVMSRGEIWGQFDERPFEREAIMHAAFREGSRSGRAAEPLEPAIGGVA
jgi:ribose transport system ATP-binding protein